MTSLIIRIIFGIMVIALVCIIAFKPTPFVDLDCADFTEWKVAQLVHDESVRYEGQDVHHLDGDNDGVACEKLL